MSNFFFFASRSVDDPLSRGGSGVQRSCTRGSGYEGCFLCLALPCGRGRTHWGHNVDLIDIARISKTALRSITFGLFLSGLSEGNLVGAMTDDSLLASVTSAVLLMYPPKSGDQTTTSDAFGRTRLNSVSSAAWGGGPTITLSPCFRYLALLITWEAHSFAHDNRAWSFHPTSPASCFMRSPSLGKILESP